MDVKKIVSQSKFAQVGFVVNDIEKAKKQFALLFGCEIPPTCVVSYTHLTLPTIA